jgi:hypothetical protein
MGNVNRRLVLPSAAMAANNTAAQCVRTLFSESDVSTSTRGKRIFSWGAWLAMNGNEHKRLRALLVA